MQKTLSVISLNAIQNNLTCVKRLLSVSVLPKTPNLSQEQPNQTAKQPNTVTNPTQKQPNQTASKTAVWAVVKADAYGHGAVRVAQAIEREVAGFCVALVDEGVALRVSGVTKPILVFTPPQSDYDVSRMRHYALLATVESEQTAKRIGALCCHIKVNTGMNRYGCHPSNLERLLSQLAPAQVQGVYSHLYLPHNSKVAESQRVLFKKAVQTVTAYAPQAVAHIAASGGVLLGTPYHFSAVRVGILLYGYTPEGMEPLIEARERGEQNDQNAHSAEIRKCLRGLTPALQVFAKRTQITECVGEGAGYGMRKSKTPYLATYRLGYADGFFRTVPLGEGNLCMDAFVGENRGEWLPVLTDAKAYAKQAGTICYEVLCKLSLRSHRIYV